MPFAAPLTGAPLVSSVAHADALALPSLAVITAETQLLAAVNVDRVANGLAPVEYDAALSAVARWRSEDMVARNYFSHDIGGYMVFQVLKDQGITYGLAGENLAAMYGTENTVARAQASLMGSPTHRANILQSEYTQAGVGVAIGPDGKHIFTQIFKLAL